MNNWKEEIIDGTRHYVKPNGDLVIADVYDKMFKPEHDIKMDTKKGFKGDNPDKRKMFLKDKKSY